MHSLHPQCEATTEAVELIEGIIHKYIIDVARAAYSLAHKKAAKISIEDVVFQIRKDPVKLARIKGMHTLFFFFFLFLFFFFSLAVLPTSCVEAFLLWRETKYLPAGANSISATQMGNYLSYGYNGNANNHGTPVFGNDANNNNVAVMLSTANLEAMLGEPAYLHPFSFYYTP